MITGMVDPSIDYHIALAWFKKKSIEPCSACKANDAHAFDHPRRCETA